MTHYFKSGNTINVSDSRDMEVFSKLPATTNYIVKCDSFGKFYLEGIDSFEMPKKVYGGNDGRRDRIIQTFLDRPRSTGVLLTGEKGSGKTLLTKSVSIELAKQGIPTIIVNTAFSGDGFNKFIQTIQEPCIVLFDEFEKVFDKDEQSALLTLLDGVFPSKKLFLLTMNDGYIDPHMRNRPGRIFYQYSYAGLTSEFIREYCEDELNDKTQIDKLIMIADCFSSFNFDMLTAVVEDMNRFNESAANVMNHVNARLQNDTGVRNYEVECFFDGKRVPESNFSPTMMHMSPLVNPEKQYMSFYSIPTGTKNAEGHDEHYDDLDDVTLTDDKLIKVEPGGNMIYGWLDKPTGKRFMVRVVKPVKLPSFSFSNAF